MSEKFTRNVRRKRAFSLAEVAIALGLVAFAMISIIALLPAGLGSLRASMTITTEAFVMRQVAADTLLMPFTDVSTLATQTHYFDDEGFRLSSDKGAYYKLTYKVDDPILPGASSGITNSAQRVIVTISYPFAAPEDQRRTITNALLVARQSNR